MLFAFSLLCCLQQRVKSEPASAPAASFSSLSSPPSSSGSGSRSAEAQRQLNSAKRQRLSEAAGDEEAGELEDLDTPAAKRGKGNEGGSSGTSSGGGGGGDPNVVQLGGSKRISVGKFKQYVLIDIREVPYTSTPAAAADEDVDVRVYAAVACSLVERRWGS
jgi:hypothetical protein